MKTNQPKLSLLLSELIPQEYQDHAFLALYFLLSLISWKLTVFAAAVASKHLDVELFGVFSVSIRAAHNFAHVFVMGQEAIILMFLSAYKTQLEKQTGLISWIVRTMIIKSGILFIIVALACLFHSSILFSWFSINMWIGLLAVPFIVISGIYERFFLFMKQFFVSFIPRGIYQPIIFIILLNLSVYFKMTVGATDVIALYAISYCICACISAVYGYYSGFILSKKQDQSDKNKWHASGLFYTFSTLVIKATPAIPLFFLKYFDGSETATGYYSAIISLTYGYHLLTKPFDSYLKPSIAILFAEGKIEELQNKIHGINRIRWFIIISFSLFLIFFGKEQLNTFGEYASAYTPLFILSLLFMAQYLGQPAHEILIGLAVSQMICGIASEYIGRKPTIMIGLVVSTIGCIICYHSEQINTLLLGRFIKGLGAGALSALWRTMIRDLFPPEKMASVLLYIQIAITCIFPAAPAIGGYIHHFFNWRTNFIVLLGYSIILLFLIMLFLPETQSPNTTLKQKNYITNGIKEILTMSSFVQASLLSFLAYGCLMTSTTFAPALLMHHMKLNSVDFGWVMFSCSLLSMLTVIVFNKTYAKNMNTKQILKLSIQLQFLGGFLMGLALEQHGHLVVSIISVTTLELFALLLIFPLATTLAFKHCGHVAGIAGSLYATIQLLGGSTLSAVVAHLPDHTTQTVGVIYVICATASLYIYKKMPHPE